jgi:hypothetical protein
MNLVQFFKTDKKTQNNKQVRGGSIIIYWT